MEALDLLDTWQQCSMGSGLRWGLPQGSGATHPMRPTQRQPEAAQWAEAGAAVGREAAAARAGELGDSPRAGGGGVSHHYCSRNCAAAVVTAASQQAK